MIVELIEETTLVIGAGGSIPYGLPSWQELSEGLSSDSQRDIYRDVGFADALVDEFLKRVEISDADSIDAMLRNNQQLSEIGRFGIACQISMREDMKRLKNVDPELHWYKELFRQIASERQGSQVLEELDSVRFLTFNYDRSLEQYLFNRLTTDHNLPESSVASRIHVHHVHGSIGSLDWQMRNVDESTLPYGPTADWQQLRKNSLGMKTLGQEKIPFLNRLKAGYIDSAERVSFLGFGFHKENCERFGLTRSGNQRLRESCSWSGTAWKMPKSFSDDMVKRNLGLVLIDTDICSFFKEYRPLKRRRQEL